MTIRCYYVDQVLFDHEIATHQVRLWVGAGDSSGVRILHHARSARDSELDAEAAGNPRAGRAECDPDPGKPAQTGIYRAAAAESAGAGAGDPSAVEISEAQRKSIHEAAGRMIYL